MSVRKPMWPSSFKLMPNHLEQHDEYLEELVAQRVKVGGGVSHGWLAMTVDDEALVEGELRITALSAVLADGSFLQEEGPLSFDVDASDGAVDVWLVWSKLVSGAPGVASPDNETLTRFRRVDEDGEAGLAPVVRLTTTPAEDEVALLVGHLEPTPRGVNFGLGTLPPLLAIAACPPVVALVDRVIVAFERRIEELVASREQKPLNTELFTPPQALALQLHVLLQRYLPLLRDVRARRVAHPEELFELLAAIVGSLSVVTEAKPEPLPRYHHDNPGPALEELAERAILLVARTARERVMAFPLKRLDETTFRVTLRADAFQGRRHYLMASGADEEMLRDRVPSLAKIATGAALNALLQSAVRGVAIAVEFDPPPELPSRRSFVCYRLDVRDRYWADIRERLDLVVHIPLHSPGLELTLYAIE